MKIGLAKKMNLLVVGVLCALLLMMFFSMASFGNTASAMTAEEEIAKLVEGAKKEGHLTLYGSTNLPTLLTYLEGFKKKYPFMKTDAYRTNSQQLLSKVMAEARMNKFIPDALKSAIMDCWTIREQGLVAKYISPESKPIAEEFKDPQGYWVAHDAVTRVDAYNTKLVSPKDVPKSYEDLLNPKWKGKMGLETAPIDWFYARLKTMGKEKGMEYMKKLAKQDIQFRAGKTLLAQLLAAGEISLGIALNGHEIERLKSEGAPVDWVPIEPVVISPGPIVVMANAPHPNAARLFVNFMHSEEGQRIVRSTHRIPLRPNVLPNPPRLIQGIKFVHPDPILIKQMGHYTRLFQDTFLRQ